MKKQQPYPLPGQIWNSRTTPVYYIFIEKVEKNRKLGDILFYSDVETAMEYKGYVSGIMARYELFSG